MVVVVVVVVVVIVRVVVALVVLVLLMTVLVMSVAAVVVVATAAAAAAVAVLVVERMVVVVAELTMMVLVVVIVVVVAVAEAALVATEVELIEMAMVCLLVACLTSQQHASVSQGQICSDNLTCCHAEIEVADQTFYLTQSQYTDTGPTSPSTDPITPGAWQGSHWSANFEGTGMTQPRKNAVAIGFESQIFRSRGGRLNY